MENPKASTLGYHWLDNQLKNPEKYLLNYENSLPTNIKGLDSVLHGLIEGQLYILAARPAEGKTTLVLNIILRTLKNLKDNEIVIFLSLEMSATEILSRILKIVNSYNIGMDIKELAAKKRLLIIDYSHSNVKNIKKIIEEEQKNKIVKSIFIDHLQLLETDNPNLPRYEKMTQITRELKIVARETHTNVFAISQLSRDVERRTQRDSNTEIQLSDLRDSGSIEQDADVVLFLYKPKMRNDKNGYKVENTNQYVIQIGKNRNGPTTSISCLLFQKNCLFKFKEDFPIKQIKENNKNDYEKQNYVADDENDGLAWE
ncbi:DnaB-like helicase C-terminal domain-containing protein [Metamycoplasma gateae]|uniref:DnaB-like helicase C-terminal domain-containing protein n=1 Tax=Metamycoplasma gateae TaxID=35769 RepID=A0ABZ2AG95_9BACT|nr:DnaB-like helicase C-terminal domain-containing protein [Metamycoplasma gateae]